MSICEHLQGKVIIIYPILTILVLITSIWRSEKTIVLFGDDNVSHLATAGKAIKSLTSTDPGDIVLH